jgi:prepilin-type N-terminal cleavage/methylation domain-containing protein
LKAIRQKSDDGFVLIELLIVLLIIGLALPAKHFRNLDETYNIEYSIITNQLEAMAHRKHVVIDSKICPLRNCWFNPKGNINKSRKLIIHQGGTQYELVIWLGFGRFKINKRISYD